MNKTTGRQLGALCAWATLATALISTTPAAQAANSMAAPSVQNAPMSSPAATGMNAVGPVSARSHRDGRYWSGVRRVHHRRTYKGKGYALAYSRWNRVLVYSGTAAATRKDGVYVKASFWKGPRNFAGYQSRTSNRTSWYRMARYTGTMRGSSRGAGVSVRVCNHVRFWFDPCYRTTGGL